MKTRHLLIAFSLSTFTIANIPQYAILAQPNQPEQTEPLTTTTAQQIAAKVTVRIQVGQSGGSGVFIGKKANTYLILTNAHVVREQSDIRIKTPDGQTHKATRVKNTQVGNFDLALLEFNSPRAYQLAEFNNFGNKSAALNEGREIFAAGFPYDSNALRVVEGEVTQLPQEAFVNGTQIGYVTKGDIKQGMSGGPIFDSFGNLVGINSTLARPVIDSYTYTNGTKAPKDKIAEYRQANWSVPIYNLLTRLNPDILYGYKNLPKLRRAGTPTGYMGQLDRQARQVTVRIENSGGNGSGVIVARDGNSYYVLTAEHVLANKKTKQLYSDGKITTQDQRAYKISPNDIKRSPGTDLAIVKFTSTQSYQVATLANYPLVDNSLVFAGGWPAPKLINSQQWQWQLNPGQIRSKAQGEFQTQDKKSFSEAYDLLHNSITYGGMSGGPIFDQLGRVIGIHGKGEGNESSTSILGNSIGISTQTFLSFAEKLSISPRKLQLKTTPVGTIDDSKLASVNLVRNNISIPNNSSNAQQWIEYGNQLYRLGKYAQAVTAFEQAIRLQPNILDAYYGKGLALLYMRNSTAALKAFDKAIMLVSSGSESKFYYLWKYRSIALRELNNLPLALVAISEAIRWEPQDNNLLNEKGLLFFRLKQYSEAMKIYNLIISREAKPWAYYNRGTTKSELGDKKGALSDYDIAIQINPQFAEAYYSRGADKGKSGDTKGAISDYNMAIRLEPKFVRAYNNRGINKLDLGDKKGAIADYDTAIQIDPQFALAYYNRGIAKSALGDKKGAIADYNTAIRLDPKAGLAYNNRGITKSALGDKKGAVADFNTAIKIDPQFAQAYSNRGGIKSELGDKKGAIADYSTAIRIDPQFADAYYNRGLSKSILGDKKGAIADYDIAIQINPQLAQAYYSRGNARSALGEKKGAISDYDLAIRIKPEDADAYYNRGVTKFELGNREGAFSDFNSAIRINPQYGEAYVNRGNVKYDSGDKKGAIADLNIAAKLFKIQNNPELYDRAMSLIQQISN
jgi:tetratricopeptide (TPR) repeat protein/S1-C subfamily serine protease